MAPLAQQYFKEDVGAASRIDISYFRENFVQDRSSFHCYVEYLTNRLARVSNDYAPDRRAAKRPDELELVIFAAVLLESSVKPILRALAHAPIHLPETQLISTYRWNKLWACLVLSDRTPRGDDV